MMGKSTAESSDKQDMPRIIQQVGLNYVIIAVGMLLAPLLPFILTRTLSVEEYGVYALFYSMIQLSIVMLELGISQYLITKIATESNIKRVNMFASLALVNVAFLVLFFAVVILPFIRDAFLSFNRLTAYSYIYYICLGIIFMGVILRLFYAYYLGQKKVNTANGIDFLRGNLWIILLIVFYAFYRMLNINSVFLLWTGSFLATIFLVLSLFSRDFRYIKKSEIRFRNAAEGLKFSLPLIPFIISGWALSALDRYMINFYEGAESVAIYTLPYSILGLAYTLATVTTGVVYPYFVQQMKGKGKDLLRNISIKYGMILVLPAVLGFLVLRHPIITLISGEKYIPSAHVVPYLFIYPVFAFSGFIIYQHALSEHKTKMIGIIYSTGAVLNIILNILLIPRFSIAGAGIATVISYAYISAAPLLFTRKIVLMRGYLRTGRVIAASMIMAGALLFFLPTTVYSKIAVIAGGAAFYFALLFLFRVFVREELLMMKNILLGNRLVKLIIDQIRSYGHSKK